MVQIAEDQPARRAAQPALFHRLIARFFEVSFIGAALVGGVFTMKQLDILPEALSLPGLDVTFPEKVREASQATDARIEGIEGNLASLTGDFVTRFEHMETRLRELELNEGTVVSPVVQTPSASVERVLQAVETDRASGAAVQLSPNKKAGVTGWVWLGTYSTEGRWVDQSVEAKTGILFSASPQSIEPGTALKAITDLNVRDGQPSNTEEYFQALGRLGFVEKGDLVTVAERPVSYLRNGAYQVWAPVQAKVRPIDQRVF